MKHYIGLDVSLKMTSICIIDANGKIVMESSTLVKCSSYS